MEKNNLNNKNNLIIQERLLQMGFDITMINKIFFYFDIQNENQAINYLILTNGKWNHPFVLKDEDNNIPNNNNFNPENMINNLVKVGTQKLKKNKSEIENEICDICGDHRSMHIQGEININNNNNINLNEKNINNSYSFETTSLLIKNKNENYNNNLEEDINTNFSITNNNNINNNIINNNIINNNNNINNNINNNLIKENSNEIDIVCPICMGDFENPITLEKCKHKFCRECFHSYLIDKINRNDIEYFSCPKINCFNKKLSEELLYTYLSENEYIKYQNFRSKNEIEKDPNKIFCPICDSYAELEKDNNKLKRANSITHFDSNNKNYIKKKLFCIKNNHEFCSCGRLIHEGNCFRDEKEFKNYLAQEKIKKCPKCGFLIKKDKGCNHMTCGNPNCKFEFCWICMNESLPNHFSEGPCAGLQFINEDSFMYKLKINHPLIYKILSCLNCLFYALMLLISIFVPFFIVMYFSYSLIYNEEGQFFRSYKVGKNTKKFLNFFQFMIVSFMGISYCFIVYGIIILCLPILFLFLFCLCCTCLCQCFCGSTNRNDNLNLINENNNVNNNNNNINLGDEILN